MNKLVPVIICGGLGNRILPLSSPKNPKQFLTFGDEYTLFQNTVLRVTSDPLFSKPLIVCNSEHRFRIFDELCNISVVPEAIIVEPERRNTAPAIALASHYLNNKFGKDVGMVVMPSDHIIVGEEVLIRSIIECSESVSEKIITFGIKPSRASASYGYIKFSDTRKNHIKKIKKFVEKPSLEQANIYIDSKEYCWNSGIIFSSVGFYLSELWKFLPNTYYSSNYALNKSLKEFSFILVERSNFQKCDNISVDYALLEKTKSGYVVPVDIMWYDLGSWQSIYNYFVYDSSRIGQYVDKPWGSYIECFSCDGVRLKLLKISAGGSTSLQYHKYRSEYLMIIKGTANIIKNNKVINLQQSESLYIHVQDLHKIQNLTNFEIEILEVQLGHYIDEDDIVRIEDKYGRVTKQLLEGNGTRGRT